MPTSIFQGGHFLCFRYVVCLCLLRGQDNDLSLIDDVGVHKTVGVALEDGLVLHQTGIYRQLHLFYPLHISIFIFQTFYSANYREETRLICIHFKRENIINVRPFLKFTLYRCMSRRTHCYGKY